MNIETEIRETRNLLRETIKTLDVFLDMPSDELPVSYDDLVELQDQLAECSARLSKL